MKRLPRGAGHEGEAVNEESFIAAILNDADDHAARAWRSPTG